MPQRDGTRQMGLGAMNGRCFGLGIRVNAFRRGMVMDMYMGHRYGCGSKWGSGRRMRRNFSVGQKFFNSTKEFLEKQKSCFKAGWRLFTGN